MTTQYRIRTLIGCLIPAMLFFLIVVEDETAGRSFLYLAGLLVIWVLARERQLVRELMHPAVMTGVVFIVYMSLTVLWGHGPDDVNYMLDGLGVLFFWLAIIIACQVPDRELYRIANVLLAVVVAGIVYALIGYIAHGNLQARDRLPGTILWSPILGPSVMIACGATGVMLHQHLRRTNIVVMLGLILCIGLYTLTTRSRGPLLGLAVWVAMWFLIDPPHRRRNLAVLGGLIVCALVFWAVFPEYVAGLIARGTSHRLTIWRYTLQMLPEHLWFGRGINYVFTQAPVQDIFVPTIGFRIGHPHNLGLAVLLYSGLAGLVLMVLTTLSGIFCLCRGDSAALVHASPVLAAILVLTLTDTNKLVHSPSPLWFIYWLPTAFIAGLALRTRSRYRADEARTQSPGFPPARP